MDTHRGLIFAILGVISSILQVNEGARILAVYPTPSFSHQVVFWPYTEALAKRGHEVVVITTDLAYPKGQAPPNITEIDVHDISYDIWRRDWVAKLTGKTKDQFYIMEGLINVMPKIIAAQIKSPQVQEILKDPRGFDMLLIEEWTRPAIVFTHLYKVPTISVSSFGSLFGHYADLGVQMHPLLYPILNSQRLNGLSLWEKLKELQKVFYLQYMYYKKEEEENKLFRKLLGEDMPSMSELSRNVDMLLLNHHPLWDSNRPVPANVVYWGGKRVSPKKDLSKEIQDYLDNSKNGTIYMSLGSNVKPSILPSDKIKAFLKVFGELPYNVLFKWDLDELPECPPNVKFAKWFQQPDILRHPKVKLFITQGGLQSTEEAIDNEVPVIGIPVLGDQWYNSEKYVHFKIGRRIEMETLTADQLKEAILDIMNNEKYINNMKNLKALMYDQPQDPLDRAVWWTEHILRHSHMGKPYRSPRADITWVEYLELDVVAVLFTALVIILSVISIIGLYIFKFTFKIFTADYKFKTL